MTDFCKVPDSNFTKIHAVGAVLICSDVHTDGQTIPSQ